MCDEILHVTHRYLERYNLLPDAKELSIRLERLEARARPLQKVAELPPPQFDPETVKRGIEQAERGEGVDSAELLSQLRADANP